MGTHLVQFMVASVCFSHFPSLVGSGLSSLLSEVFGQNGEHARSAVGVNALPLNSAVEIEFIVQVRR